jgi:hypothetical protein
MNRYIFFSCKQLDNEEIYMIKYDYENGKWNLPKRISFSNMDSITPSVCIDADDMIYIYWIDRITSSGSVGFARYNPLSDELYSDLIRPSSVPDSILTLCSSIDETKTVYLAWEDTRFGVDSGTEIYKNETINLVSFDKIQTSPDAKKTDAQIIEEQLNKFVIGNKYSDDVSPSELPISSEALGNTMITLETARSSYSIPMDVFNSQNPLVAPQIVILDSRDITIKIRGLPKTLAYRLKNIDDLNSAYSEFFEFTVDILPDTTIKKWRLSAENGKKQIGIQLYTLQGLTSPIEIDLYLNEPNIYDILIYNDSGNSIGEIVDTIYQDVTVLSSHSYWVKIKSYRIIDDTQVVKFDVIAQGLDILNNETTYDGEYYVGKFSINPQDGTRYLDGSAKIIPKILKK